MTGYRCTAALRLPARSMTVDRKLVTMPIALPLRTCRQGPKHLSEKTLVTLTPDFGVEDRVRGNPVTIIQLPRMPKSCHLAPTLNVLSVTATILFPRFSGEKVAEGRMRGQECGTFCYFKDPSPCPLPRVTAKKPILGGEGAEVGTLNTYPTLCGGEGRGAGLLGFRTGSRLPSPTSSGCTKARALPSRSVQLS